MKSHRGIFETMECRWNPCVLCGQSEFTEVASHDRYGMGIRTQACKSCGFLMTNPSPTPEALGQFYRKEYREIYRRVEAPDSAYIRKHSLDRRAAYAADRLGELGLIGSGRRILDFGCAEGSLLKEIRERSSNFCGVGVEPGLAFSAFARSYAQCPVYSSLIDLKAREAQPFGTIILIHVLEHLHDPVGFLRSLAALLTPDGALYVDVPDASAYQSLDDLHVAHLLHFTPSSLHRLCESAGLVVSAMECHRPPRHPASVRVLLRKEGVPVTRPNEGSTVQDNLRRIDRSHAWYSWQQTPPLRWILSAFRRLSGARR